MVTRRRSKAASAVSTSPQLAKTAKVFASPSELERKRKSEQSMADQIAALREMVLQLIKGQAEQKTWLEGQEARYTEEIQKQAALLKELVKEPQGQQRSTTALEAAVAKSVRKPSYSEVSKGDHAGTPRGTQAVTGPARAQKNRPSDHAPDDDRAVSIDIGKTKADKVDFAAVKEKMQAGLDKAKATEGLAIEFLRPGP
jgi:hypothetical protein